MAIRLGVRRAGLGFALATLFVTNLPATQGASPQSHEQIRTAIRGFLLAANQHLVDPADIEVGVIDYRLRLARCPTGLDVFIAEGSTAIGRTTVGVRCPGPPPWKIYVPSRVKVMREIVVTVKALARGTPVSVSDVGMDRRDISGLTAGYFETPQTVIGQITRRPLAAGHAVDTRAVEKPVLVHRGDRVLINAGSAMFSVKMRGKALMDGTAGDRIRVQNLSSGRIVEGRITATGEIRVSI